MEPSKIWEKDRKTLAGWSDIEILIGRIVIKWGHAMGAVYSLPEKLGFENFEAVRFGLAQMSGDGSRLDYMRKLISHEPKLYGGVAQRAADAKSALKLLGDLIPRRDAIIHGIPTFSMKRDNDTLVTIRKGTYLVQQREWEEERRYLPMPDAATQHLEKLGIAYEQLQRVATPMLFEDWESFFGAHLNKTTDT